MVSKNIAVCLTTCISDRVILSKNSYTIVVELETVSLSFSLKTTYWTPSIGRHTPTYQKTSVN